MKANEITMNGTGLNHKSYLDCYNNNIKISVDQSRIGSRRHQLYTYKGKKIALTNTDDKRVWIDKNKSLPYGHCNLSLYNEVDSDSIKIE